MKSRLKDPTRQAELLSDRPVKKQESKVSKKQRKVKVSEEKGQLCRLLQDIKYVYGQKKVTEFNDMEFTHVYGDKTF